LSSVAPTTVTTGEASPIATWLPPSRSAISDERAVRRRIAIIWALLFFNVMSYAKQETIFPIPSDLGKILTQGALALAFLLALTVNRKLVVRPNTFLVLSSILAVAAVGVSIRDQVSIIGSDYRAIRLVVFVAVLWLLTPWWGRKDMFLMRCQLRALYIVLGMVLLGFMIDPGKALAFEGRLQGTIWPIPATQVAHYAAVTGGMTAVLWFAGLLRRNAAAVMFLCSVVVLVLTHTRTALIAMLVAILVAALSLFTRRRRVRRVLTTLVVVFVLSGVVLLPALTQWFSRGQSTEELSQLTGRTIVWTELIHTPQPTDNVIFGNGLSNNSFNGLPIDDSWLAVYQDQGLLGDLLCGLIMISLLLIAAFRPRGPAKALALFLLVYCLIASVTETGLGQPSTYMLDLATAAALLMPGAPKLLAGRGDAEAPPSEIRGEPGELEPA
jgi:O-Antigen ligase